MNAPPQTHDLEAMPVFDFLSEGSRHALSQFIESGNSQFRQRQLLEFFRSLDWLPMEEIRPNPLTKIPEQERQEVRKDIRAYLAHKSDQKTRQSQQRQEYTQRVFEYFRLKVPPDDKALLESLRDYELELTDRDVNWQHHFRFSSFKQIDAFLGEERSERQQRIEAFRKDVLTYKKNRDKIYRNTHHDCDDAFDFDAWCRWNEDLGADDLGSKATGSRQQGQRTARRTSSSETSAWSILELPETASLGDIKKQFRRLTLTHHPDIAGGSTEKMQELVNAYETLKRRLEG